MPTKRSILHAKADVDRVPSGAVQFGNDWPGLFLRGDHAISIALSIRQLHDQVVAAGSDGPAWDRLLKLASLIEKEVDEGPPASA